MNSQSEFEAIKTRQAVARLLKQGPDAPDLLELIGEVAKAVREDALADGNPDATATFNEVLRAGGFQLEARRFVGGDFEIRNALCVARVFAELARTPIIFDDHSSETTWGWCALSRNAQGWCWSLLRCSEPKGRSTVVGFSPVGWLRSLLRCSRPADLSERAHRDWSEAKALILSFAPPPYSLSPEADKGESRKVSPPETCRVWIPATRNLLDFGGRGSVAIQTWANLRELGQNPECLGPGVGLEELCPYVSRRPERGKHPPEAKG